jgi:hypothetical protein
MVSMQNSGVTGGLTVQQGIAIPLSMLRGRLAVGNEQLCLGRVEQLHEEVDEDAQCGGRQVAHALGQRHGVQ